MANVKNMVSSSLKNIPGKASKVVSKFKQRDEIDSSDNVQEDLLVMDIMGLKKIDIESLVDGGPIDDYYDAFQKTDLHIEKIPTMLSHAIVTNSEDKNIELVTEYVIASANNESSWNDALLALNDFKVQRTLSHRAALILTLLHPQESESDAALDRYNAREDVTISIDRVQVAKFRTFRSLLTTAFTQAGISEVTRATHIAMVGLANNGDLRKIISCDVPTEPMVDVLDVSPSPIPDENAGMPQFKAQAIAELSSSENELINTVANQYIADNKVI